MKTSPRWWQRLTSTADELDAEQMREAAAAAGADAIEDVVSGQLTTLTGVLNSILYCPEDKLPVLEADLFDGSGHIDLKWIGRRRIRGLVPGVGISVTGRLVKCGDRLTMFNPLYTLLPRGAVE